MNQYQCSICGLIHDTPPAIGGDSPVHWREGAEQSADGVYELTSETCRMNDQYFIRAVLEIPLLDGDEPFIFDVWVSLKRENFLLYRERPDSGDIGPFFGWFSTDIAYYADPTVNLKTAVHFRGDGLRPTIELEPSDHPLSIDYHHGITLAKAWEIVHFYADPPAETG